MSVLCAAWGHSALLCERNSHGEDVIQYYAVLEELTTGIGAEVLILLALLLFERIGRSWVPGFQKCSRMYFMGRHQRHF